MLLFFAFDECKYLNMIPIALPLAQWSNCSNESTYGTMIGDMASPIDIVVAFANPTQGAVAWLSLPLLVYLLANSS
jgi:hypothetical protein